MSTQEQDGGQAAGIELVVPALGDRVGDLRRAARRYAEEHGVARPDDVELVVGEAATNAVVHAYTGLAVGPVKLTGALDPASVVLVVADEGTGLGSRRGGRGLGWGLLIIADLTDAFEISAHDGGTRVRMRFARELAA